MSNLTVGTQYTITTDNIVKKAYLMQKHGSTLIFNDGQSFDVAENDVSTTGNCLMVNVLNNNYLLRWPDDVPSQNGLYAFRDIPVTITKVQELTQP